MVDGEVVVGVVTCVVADDCTEAGATPLGFEMRKSPMTLAEAGFGIEAPFGTNAIVISWPFSNRRFAASVVRTLPVVAVGDFQTFTSRMPGLPSHF